MALPERAEDGAAARVTLPRFWPLSAAVALPPAVAGIPMALTPPLPAITAGIPRLKPCP